MVDKLNAEIAKVINRPDVKEAWAKQGAVPMVMSPKEFDAYLRKDVDKWADVVKKTGAIGQLNVAAWLHSRNEFDPVTGMI